MLSLKILFIVKVEWLIALIKKLNAHDKMLENINSKLDEFSYVLKNQLSFNKMIEIQLAQIVVPILWKR